MKNTFTDQQLSDRFRQIRKISEVVAFEEVISWVYQAPDPSPSVWWQRWWFNWRN